MYMCNILSLIFDCPLMCKINVYLTAKEIILLSMAYHDKNVFGIESKIKHGNNVSTISSKILNNVTIHRVEYFRNILVRKTEILYLIIL